MKSITYDGVAAITTDDVADALLQLAITVARYSSYELVSIPVVERGRVEELTLMLGPTIHLSAMSVTDRSEDVLEQSASVARRLMERAKLFGEFAHFPDPQADDVFRP